MQGDNKEISSKFEDLKIFSKITSRLDEPTEDFSVNFENLSLEYKFRSTDEKTNDIESICAHNSRIATSYEMHDVALTWNSLRELASELKTINQSI